MDRVMRKGSLPIVFAGLLGAAIYALPASATASVISGVTVASVSSQLSQYGYMAANTVNGAGLDASGDHSTDPTTMWLTTGNGAAGGTADPNPYITFKLPSLSTISSIGVYNYNEVSGGNNLTARGVSSFELYGSTDGVTFADLGTETLNQAPGTNTNFMQQLSVNDVVQYVQFANLVAFPGDDNGFTGLSAVQFTGTATTADSIPEPASLSLVVAGVLALVSFRKSARA